MCCARSGLTRFVTAAESAAISSRVTQMFVPSAQIFSRRCFCNPHLDDSLLFLRFPLVYFTSHASFREVLVFNRPVPVLSSFLSDFISILISLITCFKYIRKCFVGMKSPGILSLCTCRIFVPQAMEMQAVFSTFARLSRLLN
jgi:hypothetical protein